MPASKRGSGRSGCPTTARRKNRHRGECEPTEKRIQRCNTRSTFETYGYNTYNILRGLHTNKKRKYLHLAQQPNIVFSCPLVLSRRLSFTQSRQKALHCSAAIAFYRATSAFFTLSGLRSLASISMTPQRGYASLLLHALLRTVAAHCGPSSPSE
jgi:hypothetical protein